MSSLSGFSLEKMSMLSLPGLGLENGHVVFAWVRFGKMNMSSLPGLQCAVLKPICGWFVFLYSHVALLRIMQ